jgi:hypothetical protein
MKRIKKKKQAGASGWLLVNNSEVHTIPIQNLSFSSS